MRQQGQALVPVLFVVFILTAFAVTVSTSARREVRAASNYLKETQQQQIAMGAVTYAMGVLEQATNGGTTPAQLSQPPDTDANGWTQLGDGFYKLEYIDTTSRLNINTADLATLGKLPAMINSPSLAAAIVDWRDADDNPTTSGNAQGAESDYYGSLNPPYNAKNAPFDTVDELLLVQGFTPEILYGAGPQSTDTTGQTSDPTGMMGDLFGSRSAHSRQSARPPTGGTGASTTSSVPAVDTSSSTTPLSELITTFSRELNVASDGTARINVKTASQTDITTALGAQIATKIMNGRAQNSSSWNSIADLLGNPLSKMDMQTVGDKIIVADAQYREGVININTAPAEVLATIPGVDATVYNAIIQARQSGTVFTGLNDLFQLNLSRTQFVALVDHVCTKSSVYLVRIRVRIPGSQKIYAVQALIQLTPPQQQSQTGANGQTTTPATTDTTTLQPAVLYQFREVPRRPGWTNWATAPNFYQSGGTVVTP